MPLEALHGPSLPNKDARIGCCRLKDRQIPKIHHEPKGLRIEQMLAEVFAVACAEPFVGGDEGSDPAGAEEFMGAGVEVDVEVGALGVDVGEAFAEDGLLRLDQLHAHGRGGWPQ